MMAARSPLILAAWRASAPGATLGRGAAGRRGPCGASAPHVPVIQTFSSRRLGSAAGASNAGESFATRSVAHPRAHAPGVIAALTTPIVTATTFLLDDCAHGARLALKDTTEPGDDGFIYGRWGSPTNHVAERVIASLEGTPEGSAHPTQTRLFGSGMAAISSTLISCLKAGDHAVLPEACYGGTHEFMDLYGEQLGIEVSFVDGSDAGAYASAIQPNTTLLYGETSMNPTMRVTDLSAVGALSREVGATFAVDNTFASPYHTRPLVNNWGVDVVIHSATKYLSGHSDVTAGCVSSADADFMSRLTRTQRLFGGILSPHDAYNLLRGIKTLDVRMQRHAESAMLVAQHLEAHDKVSRVWYPGLPSHPDHELARRQYRDGYSAMIAFEVVGGADGGRRVCEALGLVNLAVSLGSVESLIEHPATMTHAMVAPEERASAGITDGMLRFSVGLEGAADIVADLDQALAVL